ncbi:Fat storage-inducing transmembrane protein [Cladochytrium replicatum]|nr:Fat storage-inducing transmembrane protein [Cladochytrium replicatum]
MYSTPESFCPDPSLAQLVFQIPPSVFSNKRNPINVIFVKNGWAWTIIPLMTLLAMNFIHSSNDAGRRRAARNGFYRIALATVYWIFITQWFFGYSLFERVHVATGHCRVGDNVLESPNRNHCRQNGGHWHGVDISGHCFLLIHSSLTILR